MKNVRRSPAEIGAVTTDLLDGSRFNPLFNSGWGMYDVGFPLTETVETNPQYNAGPSWIMHLYEPLNGSAIAADPIKRSQLLAEAIPALSLPVGANFTGGFSSARNYDLPRQFADPIHWPRGKKPDTGISIWYHSDMRDVAFPYEYRFFDKLVSISNQ